MRLFTINSVPLHNEMSVSCGENDGEFFIFYNKRTDDMEMPSMDCSTACFVRFLLNHAFTGNQPVVISLSILLLARSTVVVSSVLR